MAVSVAYRGAAPLLGALKPRLAASDFELCAEPAAASVVLTFFTNQVALEDAYFATDGLIAIAAAGTLLVDLSAASPDFARDVATMAAVSELAYVAAPIALRDVAGDDPFALGNVRMFVAGDEEPLKTARPLLELLSDDIEPVRNAGAAQLARAALTLQTTALLLGAVESAALCRRFADSSHGTTEPPAADPLAAQVLAAVAAETFASSFTIELLMGELTAALTAAEEADLILPQAEAAQNLLELLAIIGGIDKAPAALSLIYDSEEAALRHGLDWSRAQSFDADGHDHDHDFDDDDLDGDFDENADEEDFPLMVGFDDESFGGGVDPFEYSSN